jgi:thioesterase domain-containing protein/acyl carrier protein
MSSLTTLDLVLDCFSSVLNREVSIDDDFFDIGGDSLAAAQVVTKLNAATESNYELSLMFQCPTPRGIITLLHASDSKGVPAIRTLRAGVGPIPIVCVHPGNGSAGYYALFASACPPDFPVLGIHPDFSILNDHTQTTMESYVSQHIHTLRCISDARRLVIAGTCTGALIAFETARQLEEDGSEVCLIMIDPSPPPTDDWRLCPIDKPLSFKLLYFLHRILYRIKVHDIKTILRGRRASRFLRRLHGHLSKEEKRLYSYQDWILSAEAKYRPKPYAGSSIIIHSQQLVTLFENNVEKWHQYLPTSMKVVYTSGLHNELLTHGLASWFKDVREHITNWSKQLGEPLV